MTTAAALESEHLGARDEPLPLANRPEARRFGVFTTTSVVVVALILVPLVFLLVQAAQAGWGEVSRVVFTALTAQLLWNTVQLAAIVTVAAAAIGTALAWVTERTDLPGRRVWAVLVVLPLAIPDFVIAEGWWSIDQALHGLFASALVLTLGLYPLVYLPVAASFRSADPAEEEVARGLGLGPLSTFFRVTLRTARTAVLGGCLLVSLYLLAEYGAFSIFRFRTFTTEIFTQFQVGFNTPVAAVLSLVLVLLGVLVLAGEASAARRGIQERPPARPRRITPVRLGRRGIAVTAALVALVALAVGVPVGTIVYWTASSQHSTLPAAVTLGSATAHTVLYSFSAAALATVLALPVAIVAVRRRGRLAFTLERTSMLVQALPGLVIALGLVFFAVRYARIAYQSAPLLVVAYVIEFFPLALVAVRASVARMSPDLEDVARASGARPLGVLARVTLPLVLPGLLAAFSLVFLTALTELTATLILVPTGVQTLATQFWAYTGQLSFGAAAPFAAVMLGLAVVPTYVLGRWFDRLPSRSALG